MSESPESFEEQFTQDAHFYDLWKHDFTVGFNFHRCSSYRHILSRLALLPRLQIYRVSSILRAPSRNRRRTFLIKKKKERRTGIE